jgi:glycosyltransferase involved in cell wall biosynthesis
MEALVPCSDVATRSPNSAARGSAPDVILDISRLLSRVALKAPTGVDRVEMAYARRLLELAPDRLSFAAIHPCGLYGRLATKAVAAFLDDTLQAWGHEGPPPGRLARVTSPVAPLWRLLPQFAVEPIAARHRPRVYLQVSPHHLDQPQRVRRILLRERARFVCLIHDLIPIEHPEYARPKGADQHQRRMDTVAALADGVITASECVRQSFQAHLRRSSRAIAIKVTPLGVERSGLPAPAPTLRDATPYFVAVGTIEPRKNHLLMLNLWRRLVEERGPAATPKLLLIGRRGWENENVLDMLDRCPALKDVVEEHGHLPDQEMWPLIQGARALLMPSFAEGFGLPVIEALHMGVPVLCSDIPSHREVAGDVAELLDPLDGPGWRRAILDYAEPTSLRRAEQLGRLTHWRAPTWEAHVDAALELIDEINR